MKLHFWKYQGAGNDFVMLDNRCGDLSGILSTADIAKLCDRRFGIGADGLLLLSHDPVHLFRMEYYNQDGSRASFCGNGARCICAFASSLGLAPDGASFSFVADDGVHKATCHAARQWVDLIMKPVDTVSVQSDGAFVLNTGVPHYVRFVDDVDSIDIMSVAPAVRYSSLYAPDGVNVNFVQHTAADEISVRTYERGVEGETLACGTGITASAIAASLVTGGVCVDEERSEAYQKFRVCARGGKLEVSFHKKGQMFSDVCLGGPAVPVFEGYIEKL